jgi:signal transduction histidine kinase/CheY-like chemotaxis protein
VEAVLSDRVIIERTTTAILDDFVNCDLDHFDQDMVRVLSRLGAFIGANRCYLYKFGARNQEGVRWLGWQNPGADGILEPPEILAVDATTRIYKILENDPVVLVNRVEDSDHPLASHPPWSQAGVPVGSCGAVRIIDGDNALGFLGFDVAASSEWGADETNLLQIVASQFCTMAQRLEARRAQQEAMDSLKASNKAKTEFLANMSHEIRTPLNGVIGIADLLLEMELSPPQREYAEIISKSGTMLMNLVTDILDLSKIEAGKLEFDPVDTDLRALVEDLIGLTAFNAQSQGLEMICRLAPSLPERILVDPGRLRQVLINLMNNAVKFTQEGHIFLNIETVDNGCGGRDLQFLVQDTGIGISQEQADRIFRKFAQADASTTRRFGGTGLGLSICRHLVELMGGRIQAKGEIGVGSTFSFTLPLEELAPPLPKGFPDEVGRILLVTGHELVGQVLAEQIRHLGHECLIISEVKEAEKILTLAAAGQAQKWDAVALDPATLADNVYFILAKIEDSPAERRPKVFLLSQLVDKPQFDARWSPYVDGILPRPVRTGRLAALLEGKASEVSAILEGDGHLREVAAEPQDQAPDRPLRVLLAEDNFFNQKVACGMLERLGCEVTVAADGVEAVAQSETRDFDLIFMDCQMPNMDGYEASRHIRKLDGSIARTPIIAITANAFREDRDACMAAGMDDFLTKPVKMEQLALVLSKWSPHISPPETTLI